MKETVINGDNMGENSYLPGTRAKSDSLVSLRSP